MKKLVIAVVIISFLTVIISLAIAELVVKTFAPQLTFNKARFVGLKVFKPSDVATFELQPKSKTQHFGYTSEFNNTVTINGLGFRGEEIDFEKEDDVFRILMFGDSMVFGWGVEDNETTPVILQNYLNQLPVQKRVEVVNAGFAGGRSPDSYYVFLMNKGLLLQPDLVIINIFPYNDFSDFLEMNWREVNDMGYPLAVESADKLVLQGREVSRKKTNWKYEVPFIRNTHLGILLFNFMEKSTPRLVMFIKSILGIEVVEDRTNLEENAECIYEQICPDKFRESFAKMRLLFKAFGDMAEYSGTTVLISIMPAYEQVKSLVSQQHPQQELRVDLEGVPIPYLDLLPGMTKGKVEAYYFSRDGHLTAVGTRRVAYTLLEYLTTERALFLPGVLDETTKAAIDAKLKALEPD